MGDNVDKGCSGGRGAVLLLWRQCKIRETPSGTVKIEAHHHVGHVGEKVAREAADARHGVGALDDGPTLRGNPTT